MTGLDRPWPDHDLAFRALSWLRLLRAAHNRVWPSVVFGDVGSATRGRDGRRESNLGVAIYLIFVHSYLGRFESSERLDAPFVMKFVTRHVMHAKCDPTLMHGACKCSGMCGRLREDVDTLVRLQATPHQLRDFLALKWNGDSTFARHGTLP